jgi:integrase
MATKKKTPGLYQRGAVYWIKYYKDGRPIREPVRGAVLGDGSIATGLKEREAERLLALRKGDVVRGAPLVARAGRLTVDDALQAVVTDFRVNGKRTLDDVAQRIRSHLLPAFGGRRLVQVTTTAIQAYQDARQAQGAANGTINREVALLKRAFTLAIRSGQITTKPYIPMLQEAKPRQGFFERDEFDAVLARLPEALRPMILFAFLTGWRIPSEILRLQWRQVDFEGGTITLDPGTTKNKDGRCFPLTAALRALLVGQRAATDQLQRERGIIIPWVFFWSDGRRIRSYIDSWRTACRAAGHPGKLPHDFRRTAARAFERAGIPRTVAMQLLGHKTESMYRRYAIVAAADLQVAAAKLDAVAQQPAAPATRTTRS